jgi:hypothetical protein
LIGWIKFVLFFLTVWAGFYRPFFILNPPSFTFALMSVTPQTQEDIDGLEAQLKTLRKAINTGVREVYYGDKRVVYRDLKEMLQVEQSLLSQLGVGNKNPGRKFAQFDKGLS